MANTTAAAIRSQMVTAIEAVVPVAMSGDRFLHAQHEVDFDRWAEENPSASFRRFSVRFEAADQPLVSNTDRELRRVTFAVLVAYPHDYRYGSDNLRSMDDVMEQDQHSIEGAVGLRGFLNFADSAVVEPSSTSILRGDSNDFLYMSITAEFWRSFA